MITMRVGNWHFTSILGLSLLLCVPATGEDAEFNSFINDGLPPPADINPTFNPPPPPPQDRKDGSGAAVAMAIVGAAMAGASCAMLMQQAAQEPDPSTAAQLRAMAMQQCAQAAANAANAAKNNDGQEQITSQPPQEGQLDALPQLAKNNEKNDPNRSAIPTTKADEDTEEVPSQEFVNVDEFIEPDFDVFDANDDFDTGIPETGVGVGDGLATLDPIDKANVTFDDSSKGDDPTPDVPLGASTTQFSFAAGANGKANNLKTDAEKNALEYDDDARKRRRGKLDEILAAVDGGGSSSSGKGGGSKLNLNQMMGDLLGKNKPEGRVFGSGPQVVKLPQKAERTPNIFEYASFRYRQSEKDGLVVRPIRKKPKKVGDVAVARKPKW